MSQTTDAVQRLPSRLIEQTLALPSMQAPSACSDIANIRDLDGLVPTNRKAERERVVTVTRTKTREPWLLARFAAPEERLERPINTP